MQPSSALNLSNNKSYTPTQEHRLRLYQLLNDLDDEQLRLLITNHSNNSLTSNQLQHFVRVQLYQQCLNLIDNCYSTELEQTLYAMRQKRVSSDFYKQLQQNFSTTLNNQQQQQPYFFPQQTIQFNVQPTYRFSSSSPTISQQLKTIRPNSSATQLTNILNSTIQPQSSYSSSLLARPQPLRQGSPSTISSSHSSFTPVVQRYQVPLLPPSMPSSSTPSTPTLSSSNNSQQLSVKKIVHKTLPFYRSITCVYERHHIFQYDTYRQQYTYHDEFILSLDACNQLALSYDYDLNLGTHKTHKCLLLRLVRIDQPPTTNGRYDDNLPPNLIIHINGHHLSSLPIPKACTRQQTDLIRIGREVDITSQCMFNPILKNDITISWSYKKDNNNLHAQYANADYAAHIFLVEHLTVDDLCEEIMKKPIKFFREDLIKLLAKAHANDRDLGLEVSDQKLKLICPIDKRRLKTPTRATTCQHLQCFDLRNYVALNEKSNKWTCPVCNKLALFENLQIDYFTQSILNSILNENITEITISRDLHWTPILQSNINNESIDSKSNIKLFPSFSSSTDVILIDDD